MAIHTKKQKDIDYHESLRKSRNDKKINPPKNTTPKIIPNPIQNHATPKSHKPLKPMREAQ
ncbi:hypothetical protein [Helicobacter sp. MIT 01-3238]|uniref:hypothetical protein n=1 Tax=Helicobacter sp. MIT 01-3238 TaxID=398627 RepID=UPI000E1E9620|nr:hypothetical protein [Helicobacter sp. MIT 01-3238]RDU51301.1 hypothetical protein CQA40_10610 [Helicobacter sp. MIT 01-3238]